MACIADPEAGLPKAENRRRERGHAVVEFALLTPWILLLFAGIVDFGMYCKALIVTENAVRAAALQTSATRDTADDLSVACPAALGQMKSMANVANLTNCDALPLHVTISKSLDAENFWISRVSVTYQTVHVFDLPYLPGQMVITRVAEMRAKP